MSYARRLTLRLYEGATTHKRWQNFYPGITLSGGWAYLPFDAEGFNVASGADQATMRLSLPGVTDVAAVIEDALAPPQWLAEVRLLELDQAPTATAPPGSEIEVSRFVGQIIGAEGHETITVSLGAAITPVGAQVPPRVFSPRLTGYPPRL
jgi:hypothetical protein